MYKQQIILFHVGASGHFLANFLIVDKKLLEPQFRIDWKQTNSNIVFVGYNSSAVDRRLQQFKNNKVLEDIRKCVQQQTHQVMLSHYLEVSQLRDIGEHVWVRKIYPKTNLFGLIKNAHFKKQNLEFIDYSQTDFITQLDQAFIIIDDTYQTILQDQDCPDDLTIDFGMLYNTDYLATLFKSVHGFAPDAVKMEWAQNYVDQQFTSCNDCDHTNIQQIIDHVKPKDFFDVAVVLFMYEKNHNTIDTNRLWTINDMPNDVNTALQFIVDNSTNYSIFR